MSTRKEKYQNRRTKEVKEFDAGVDENGHIPMYRYENGDEWKAVPKWALNVINSGEFFRSSHENTVKFTKPPLPADGFPYGIT